MNKKIINEALIIILSFSIVACQKTKEGQITGPSDVELDPYWSRVQELDNLIYPLNGASPELNHDDLQPLSFLGNAKIVGLGEATHGTKEFFQLKQRIFKYLVENYNFRIFGFEADMGESIFIDRYITTGEGDINDLMINKMHFWVWRTEEVKDLLEWMKIYNEGKTDDEKIHYMGVDCQYMTYQPDLILEYFNRVKPEFISEINPTLNMIKAMNNTSPSSVWEYYKNMDYTQKKEISDSLADVLTKINDIKSELISKSSHFEYQNIRQLVRNMQQVNDHGYEYFHSENRNYRDEYMAENTVWLSTLFGENTKIAIWTHNGHVANAMYYGGRGSMGYHLKQIIHSQYQIVGFSFSQGSFIARSQNVSGGYSVPEKQTISNVPLDDTINNLFYYAKYDNFILRISDIPDDTELGKWISKSRYFLSFGAVFNHVELENYRVVLLRDYFDVIINYDTTSAAVPLDIGFSKRNPDHTLLHLTSRRFGTFGRFDTVPWR